MAIALPIIAGVGAVYSAVSSGSAQASADNAQANAAQYNAQVAANNAAFAQEQNNYQTELNAQSSQITDQQTSSQVTSLNLRNRALLAQQTATAAAHGVQLNGTFEDLSRASTQAGEQDALNAQYSGQLKNYQLAVKTQSDQISTNQTVSNLQNQSTLDMYQAQNYRSAASTAETNTIFNTLGAAAGAAAGVMNFGGGSSSAPPVRGIFSNDYNSSTSLYS